jgi:hypothetical protein
MALYGLFGTYALFLMALFSACVRGRLLASAGIPTHCPKLAPTPFPAARCSVADTTDDHSRTVRIGVMESMNLLGSFFGQLVGGHLSLAIGFAGVFWFVVSGRTD